MLWIINLYNYIQQGLCWPMVQMEQLADSRRGSPIGQTYHCQTSAASGFHSGGPGRRAAGRERVCSPFPSLCLFSSFPPPGGPSPRAPGSPSTGTPKALGLPLCWSLAPLHPTQSFASSPPSQLLLFFWMCSPCPLKLAALVTSNRLASSRIL